MCTRVAGALVKMQILIVAGLGGRVSAFLACCWSEENWGSGQLSLKPEAVGLVLEGARE